MAGLRAGLTAELLAGYSDTRRVALKAARSAVCSAVWMERYLACLRVDRWVVCWVRALAASLVAKRDCWKVAPMAVGKVYQTVARKAVSTELQTAYSTVDRWAVYLE
jgi:hypothetical protein